MSLEATSTITTTTSEAPVTAPEATAPSTPSSSGSAVSETLEKAIETPSAEKPLDKMASRFAALTRKEKELQRKAQEHKAREEKLSQLAQIEEALQKDPLGLLQKYGHSYESLTEFVLTEGKLTPEKRLEKLEKSLQEEREAKQKAEEEAKAAAQKAEQEKAVQHFQGECQKVIDENPDAYEFSRLEENALPLMYQVAEEHFLQNVRLHGADHAMKNLLSAKEAADLIEAHYEEHYLKLANTKKLQSKLSSLTNPAPAEESSKITNGHEAIISKEKRPTTLTNAQQAQGTVPRKDPSEMTREEALEYAASLLRWE